MPEHRQLASFCQYIFSSQSHHCASHFTSGRLRTVRKAELEHTSLPHFLTSHIKKVQVPRPPATNSPDVQLCLPLSTTEVPQKPNPQEVHTTTPPFAGKSRSHWPVRCSSHPGPGSAGTVAPTAPREKHQDSCTFAGPPVESRPLSGIPSAIAWDGGNARAMVQP
jgi:hypothetical protein